MQQKKRFVWAILLIGIALAGCAAVQKASLTMDNEAKTLRPPAGKTLVFIIRPAFLGKAIKMSAHCNERYLGTTGGGTFIYTILEPGLYTFKSKAENTSEAQIQARADETIFLEQKVKMGFIKARNELAQLSTAEGQSKLLKCRLSQDCAELFATAK